MSFAAIDFGAKRTKLAICDRRNRCPVVAVCLPTLAYVPRSGPIQIGNAALEAIMLDPAGQIDDLKSRLTGNPYTRNRRSVIQADLLKSLFVELRQLATDSLVKGETLSDCSMLVPLKFDIQQSELLQQSATAAGFESVKLIPEPIAAIRFHEQQEPIVGDAAVICDMGYNTRLAVMRRHDTVWQPALEISPPVDLTSCEDGISQLVCDTLTQLQAKLSEREIKNPPMLLVGGCSQMEGLSARIKQEGWTGEILIAKDSEFAAVMGAVEKTANADDLMCTLCSFFPVSRKAKSCPNCGHPVRMILQELESPSSVAETSLSYGDATKNCPECSFAIPQLAKVCPSCGCPERVILQALEMTQGSPASATKKCPECMTTIPQAAKRCPECGFAFK